MFIGIFLFDFSSPKDFPGALFVSVAPCGVSAVMSVSYTHLRAHETDSYLVCRLLLEKKSFGFKGKKKFKSRNSRPKNFTFKKHSKKRG